MPMSSLAKAIGFIRIAEVRAALARAKVTDIIHLQAPLAESAHRLTG